MENLLKYNETLILSICALLWILCFIFGMLFFNNYGSSKYLNED